jgi:epoxide hydrolase-like predicted phosphatase
MIKAVLFDFGGVLSESGARGSIRKVFGEVYGLDLNVMNIDDLSAKMWRGQISDEEFVAEINRRHPELPPVKPEQFRAHMDAFERSEPVYAMAQKLRAAGIKTGILSNVFGIGVGPLRSGGFYEGFEPVLLSCEAGRAKPEPEFYQMAVDQLSVKPEEIIFIDDQQYCLDPARAMGMHVVLAQNPAQIVSDTKTLIQKENGVIL